MSDKSGISTSQNAEPQTVIDVIPTKESQKISKEDAIKFLKEIQENAGQISELTMEEDNLVKEFFNSLLKIIKPFSKTVEISVSSLPEKYHGKIGKAYLYITGQIALVYESGELEIINLQEQENHELLVDITGEIMLKLKFVINSYKAKTEKRVKFLMPVAKELQKVAKVFSEE